MVAAYMQKMKLRLKKNIKKTLDLFFKDEEKKSLIWIYLKVGKFFLSNYINKIQGFFRSKKSLFAYEKLSRPICNSFNYALTEDVMYYGIYKSLNKNGYIKRGVNKVLVEHGLYLGNHLPYFYDEFPFAKILTFSPYRFQLLKEKGYKVQLTPNYFMGVDYLLSNRSYRKLKEQLGPTLLFIPGHSIETKSLHYSISELVERMVETIPNKYQTYLVCLYFVDAQNESMIEVYQALGFKVVTAGQRNDPFFLSRLKTIISLADIAATNQVGTHIGYLKYMNKKVHYISQANSYKSLILKEKSFCDAEALYRQEQSIIQALEDENDELLDYYYNYKNRGSKYWNGANLKDRVKF